MTKIESVLLESLAKKYGTPLYIYSKNSLENSFLTLSKGLLPLPHLICFAVKANSNISILKVLNRLGAGMDIVSGGELYRCEKAGVAGERIVFSGIGKTKEEIEYALGYRKTGIFSFNAESLGELELLEELARKKNKIANVSLRFNPDIDAKTHPYVSTGLEQNKFGLAEEEVFQALKKFKNSKSLRVRGVSVHIGSQITTLSPLRDAFKIVKLLKPKFEKTLGYPLSVLDLGGGVGIKYKNETPPSIEDYTDLIKKIFGDGSLGSAKIVLEPGRLLSARAGVLLSRVLYKKSRRKHDFLVTDAAMTELLRPALYESFHEIVAVGKKSSSLKKMDVVGPVCETADFLGKSRNLPSSLKTGDLVAILNSGAYGMSMSSNYNSRPRVAEVLVSGKNAKLIRQRETYAQLTELEEGL